MMQDKKVERYEAPKLVVIGQADTLVRAAAKGTIARDAWGSYHPDPSC
jgi:hypothetical protein